LTRGELRSYHVLMNLRELRLMDLAPHDTIVVECGCSHIVEYMNGSLQRLHHIPSTILVFDLQYRLRCKHCRADRGFSISLRDERDRGDNSKNDIGRVIVPGADTSGEGDPRT
jgi:hypothetical protein